MADNVNYTEPAAGAGVVPVAADEIAGAKYQRIKLIHGADGVNAGDVATGNALPVVQTGTPALPTGAATAANQATAVASLATLAGAVAGTEVQADVLTMPARAATVDTITAKLATDKLHDGVTALTPKFAKISTATSGISSVVAAVTSKKIRVLSYRFQAAADVDVKFRDNTAEVDLTGAMSSGAKGGGGGAAFSPVGHFETASGNALSINLSGAVQTSGHLCYVEI